MRSRRDFRPVLETMPSKDLPSGFALVPVSPTLPVHIPSKPPVIHIDPTLPIHIIIDEPYHETIVGPDDSSTPPSLGAPTDELC